MALSEADARARAEAEVRAVCGWRIAPSARETVTVDIDGGGVLLLPTLRLTALHSLSVLGVPLDPSAVQWSASGVVKYRSAPRYSAGLRGAVVEFTHGYDTWPLDVLSIIDRLAQRGQQDPGIAHQVGAVRVATGSDGLPVGPSPTSLDREVLNRYRLPWRP